MQIYVYDWICRKYDNKTFYIGFGIDNNDNRVSIITGSHMKTFYVKKRDYFKIGNIITGIKGEYKITTVQSTLLRAGYGNIEEFVAISIHNYDEFKKVVLKIKKRYVTTYEDEIDPVTEFLNKYDLYNTGWIELHKYEKESRLISRGDEYYFEPENIKAYNCDIIPNMRVLSMDTETYSESEFKVPLAHDPKDKVLLIGAVLKDGDKIEKVAFLVSDAKVESDDIKVYCYKSQFEMIKGYIKYIRKASPDIVIGYNHQSYDYSFLVDRYVFQDINAVGYSRLLSEKIAAKRVTWTSSAFQNDFWLINCPGVIDIDIMQYAVKELQSKGNSLNEVAKDVLGESKNDLDYHTIHKYFAEKNVPGMSEIIKYCIQDCILPIKIYEKKLIRIGILERARVERISPNHVYTVGSGARAVSLLHYQCKGKYILDTSFDSREKYKGSTVMDPVPGLYKDCATVDFSSLYPSIIISENICYTTYVPPSRRLNDSDYNWIEADGTEYTFLKKPTGIIPTMLITLIEQRKVAKQRMKVSSPEIAKVWDKRQWAYKIVANSIYGLMGSSDAHFMFSIAAKCVTSQGRKHLKMTKDLLNSQPDVHVIYGDTDSCFIQIKGLSNPMYVEERCKELCKYISKQMNNKVNLEYENSFSNLLIFAKKWYVGLKSDGNYYYRGGENVKKNTNLFLKKTCNQFIDILFRKGTDEAKLYIRERVTSLLNGKIPIDEIKIGMMVNENVITAQFKHMFKHMDDNGILYKPNERIFYVYIMDSTLPKHTSKRRYVQWVIDNNVTIDYIVHFEYSIKNILGKIVETAGIQDLPFF